MIEISGFYYDGKSSRRLKVRVTFCPSGAVSIRGDNIDLQTDIDQIRISPRVADTCRSLYLPDGGKLETGDNDAIDTVAEHFQQNRLQAWLHRLEQNWRFVAVALLATLLFIYVSIEYGVPWAAKIAARSVPTEMRRQLGEQALESLDGQVFTPSRLDAQTRQHLTHLFRTLTAGLATQQNSRLEFRSSRKLGANALAFPGGIIVITDALVHLADDDQQLTAVLAHEIGHVVHQHNLRRVFQNSITALLMITLFGDISSITSLSATLPTILVQSRYSRQFESEADRYALDYLESADIPVEQFAIILTRLEQQRGDGSEFDYLSSHPAISKRIAVIRSH